MEKKRVLIVTQELEPYLNETDIANAISDLPKHLHDDGMEIRILMPRFGNINERRHRLHEVVRLSGINIIIDDEDYPLIIKVASLPGSRLQVYFLDNEEFFKRKSVFTDKDDNFYEDNADRMVFFCKGVLETVKKFGWAPDVIHCHGWMTSLVPMYLKTAYKDDPIFANSKVLYSVYNKAFEETLSEEFLQKAAIDDLEVSSFEAFGKGAVEDLYLGGASFADGVIIGSDEVEEDVKNEIVGKNGKPVLNFDDFDGELADYTTFYNTILGEDE